MKIIDALVDDISKVPHIGVLTNPWLTVGVVLQDAYILIFVATEKHKWSHHHSEEVAEVVVFNGLVIQAKDPFEKWGEKNLSVML